MNLFDIEDKDVARSSSKINRRAFTDLGTSFIEEMFTSTTTQDKMSQAALKQINTGGSMSKESINLPSPNYCIAVYQPALALRQICKPFVAVGGQDSILRIYFLNSASTNTDQKSSPETALGPMFQLNGHTGPITALKVYQPKGQNVVVVVSGSRDRSVRIWVVQTESCYKELRGHTDAVWCLDILQPDDFEPLIVGGGMDGVILIWSMLRGDVYRRFETASETAVMSIISYTPKGEAPRIFSGSEDSSISLWSLESGDLMHVLDAHTGSVMAFDILYNYGGAVSNDSSDVDQIIDLLVSCSMDKSIIVWNARTSVILRTISCHNSTIFSVKLVPIQMHPKAGDQFLTTVKDQQNRPKQSPVPFQKQPAETTTRDSDDDDEEEEKNTNTVEKDIFAKLDGDLKSIFKDIGGVVEKTLDADVFRVLTDSNKDDVHAMEYVQEVAIVSAGKDSKVVVTSLNTGGALYTMRHHKGAVTGISAFLSECDESKPDVPMLSFKIPGRSCVDILSIGTDKQLVVCRLDNFRRSVFEAYNSDKNGVRLPMELLNKVPDEFRAWGCVYNESLAAGLTLEEYFSHESFAIFQQAIIDDRPDFVELFLKKCPRALVLSTYWQPVIQEVRRQTKIRPSQARDSDDDTNAGSVCHSISEDICALNAESKCYNPDQSLGVIDQFISPVEAHAKRLLIGQQSHVIVDAMFERQKRQLLSGVFISLANLHKREESCLKYFHDLNKKYRTFIDKKHDIRGSQDSFSLLAVAIGMRDVRSITAILNVWLALCNTPAKAWIDQVAGAFTRLPSDILVDIANLYPVIFQNFMCDLQLQPVHPYVMQCCTTKVGWKKDFVKKGSLGHISKDVGFWTNKFCTELQPMNVGYYLPLAHCADPDLIRTLEHVSKSNGDIRLFESEVVQIAVRFLWSFSGLRLHILQSFFYFAYLLVLNTFIMRGDSVTRILCTVYVSISRLSEFNNFIWSNDIWYFARYNFLISFFMDVSVYVVLQCGTESVLNSGPPFYRWILSVVVLFLWTWLVMRLQPFASTGPIISTIFEITYDIRAYLLILGVIMFAFASAMWSLCSANMVSPLSWSVPILPSMWPGGLTSENYPPQSPWLIYPDFTSGEATLGEPGSPYQYSTLQSSFLNMFSNMIQTNFAPNEFNACGVFPNGVVNEKVRGLAIFYQGVYTVLVSIIMLNVLIAIMSSSYERLSERGKAQVFLNQSKLLEENSFSIALHARTSSYTTDSVNPKLIYVLKKKSLEFHEETNPEDGENEQSDEKIVARTLIATKDFATYLDEQYDAHSEGVSSAVVEDMEIVHGLHRDLDLLVRTVRG